MFGAFNILKLLSLVLSFWEEILPGWYKQLLQRQTNVLQPSPTLSSWLNQKGFVNHLLYIFIKKRRPKL